MHDQCDGAEDYEACWDEIFANEASLHPEFSGAGVAPVGSAASTASTGEVTAATNGVLGETLDRGHPS